MADKKKETKQAKKQQVKKAIKKGRTVDKWKKKQWFNIIAPNEFDRVLLGETVTEKPKNIVGRKIKVDLGQLTGQRQKRHISVLFKIEKIEGNNASCFTTGHTVSQGFLNRLVRRKLSKIEVVQTISTSDGKRLKIKSIGLSVRKLSKKQKADIGKQMKELITQAGQGKKFAQISQEVIFGTTASKIFKILTKIAPLRHVEIIKSELMEGK